MRYVDKNRSVPDTFIEAIKGVAGYNALYNNTKQLLLTILISEQKGLCAYCNQKIIIQNATVEHLICQSHNPNYDLNYHNLFAVCKGNDGVKTKSHCDKYRANGSGNDYFFPFILFDKCVTQSWDNVNPFFDVELYPKTKDVTGKIIAKQQNVNGYPSIKNKITNAIAILNLNAEILIEARKQKWEEAIKIKEKREYTWMQLFEYYLNLNPLTDFSEFVLLAIRKQAP